MRLIDADKLNPDRMTKKGTVAISQSQIAKAPTIQAVPIKVLDKIRAEIKSISPKTYPFLNSTDNYVKEDDVLQIIDKYREEQ